MKLSSREVVEYAEELSWLLEKYLHHNTTDCPRRLGIKKRILDYLIAKNLEPPAERREVDDF